MSDDGVMILRSVFQIPSTVGIAAAWVLAFGGTARAQSSSTPPTPDWLTFDAEAKTATIKITAALTHVNGGWNFNGYTSGDLTITVPLAWRVSVSFVSRDANVPHSVGIIDAAPDALPPSGDQAKVAFRGAYSYPFAQGVGAWKEQSLDFVANKAGTFLLYCGVAGHAASGMWDYFVVAEGIDRPTVTTKEKKEG